MPQRSLPCARARSVAGRLTTPTLDLTTASALPIPKLSASQCAHKCSSVLWLPTSCATNQQLAPAVLQGMGQAVAKASGGKAAQVSSNAALAVRVGLTSVRHCRVFAGSAPHRASRPALRAASSLPRQGTLFAYLKEKGKKADKVKKGFDAKPKAGGERMASALHPPPVSPCSPRHFSVDHAHSAHCTSPAADRPLLTDRPNISAAAQPQLRVVSRRHHPPREGEGEEGKEADHSNEEDYPQARPRDLPWGVIFRTCWEGGDLADGVRMIHMYTGLGR